LRADRLSSFSDLKSLSDKCPLALSKEKTEAVGDDSEYNLETAWVLLTILGRDKVGFAGDFLEPAVPGVKSLTLKGDPLVDGEIEDFLVGEKSLEAPLDGDCLSISFDRIPGGDIFLLIFEGEIPFSAKSFLTFCGEEYMDEKRDLLGGEILESGEFSRT
jgi:hypothetical protein